MGTWGYGPFDNDAASVWCEDLEDAARKQRPTMFRELFKAVVAEEEYLDITLASEAIAAAAIIASLLPGGEEIESGFDLDVFGADESTDVPDDLPKLARKALDRVFDDNSEWMEQWKDDGDLDEAMAELEPIRELLGS